MKTIFTVLGLLLSGSLFAQNGLAYGIKAGLNVSNFGGGNFDDASSRLGLHIAIVGELEISDKFSLQPEIQYSQQGYTEELIVVGGPFDPVITDATIDFNRRLDYINIPIILKYAVVENLSIEAGPQLGFAISERVTFDGDKVDLSDQPFNYAAVEVGIAGGVGYYLDNGLFFQARYIFGLTDVNAEDVVTLDDNSTFNRNLQISVGFKL